MLDGFPTRAAWALCTFAYSAGPGAEPVLFEGRTNGRIVPARGPPKFGWDPVFEAEDTGLTYVRRSCLYGEWSLVRETDGDENAFFLQLRRDGGDAEKRDFPPGPCAAKVAPVPTGARRRGRRRIIHIGWFTPSGFRYPSDIHKVDAEYKGYSFVLLLEGYCSMEDSVRSDNPLHQPNISRFLRRGTRLSVLSFNPLRQSMSSRQFKHRPRFVYAAQAIFCATSNNTEDFPPRQ